jgi:hypothetical protein
MTKLLVLYYSTYGHVETLAAAVAEGARSAEDIEVTVKRVPETMPLDVAKKAGAKLDQAAPMAFAGRIGRLRRHHFWHAHAVWEYGCPDAEFPCHFKLIFRPYCSLICSSASALPRASSTG